jgi:hypothetical protein
MEPPSADVPFGPGLWYVRERQGALRIPLGQFVEVRQTDDWWEFWVPELGKVVSSRVDLTSVNTYGGLTSLTNTRIGIFLVVSRTPPGDEPRPETGQLSKEAQRALQAAMAPGESAKAWVAGFAGSAIIVTDRRVYLFKRMPLTAGKLFSWPIGSVTDLRFEGGSLTIEVVGRKLTNLPPAIIPVRGASTIELQTALRAAHQVSSGPDSGDRRP